MKKGLSSSAKVEAVQKYIAVQHYYRDRKIIVVEIDRDSKDLLSTDEKFCICRFVSIIFTLRVFVYNFYINYIYVLWMFIAEL